MDFSTITLADLQGAGIGLTSDVFRIRNTNMVAKVPASFGPPAPFGPEVHEVEKRIYERVGKHPHILQYLGQSPAECAVLKGALLFEYHSQDVLRHCIHNLHRISPRYNQLPRQVASALAHVHSRGVVHCDLGLHNILLTDSGDVVLCDFAGSILDGSRPFVAHGDRYADPLRRSKELAQRDDVFALGTVMYEIACGKLLFEGLEDWEIHERLAKREFPDLSGIPTLLRDVIEKCWTEPEYTAKDALADLDAKASPPAIGVAVASGVLFLAMAAWKLGGRGRL
ncbi:hypothetical protein ACRALDRAFT_2034779 [Sodiomyces alcalophilus JCM 7366]|uniref:uncharacterized protein n=1 Tax=Sodiomyces alcalophilus JCM 7366 TaxID=591952 RepID=UPI0039B4269C